MHRTEKRPSPIELPSREAGEGAALWFALGFPIVTFLCWLTGLLLLHPWVGFLTGVALSVLIARRLVSK